MFFRKHEKKYIIYMQSIQEIGIVNYPIDCFISNDSFNSIHHSSFKYKIQKFFKKIKSKFKIK